MQPTQEARALFEAAPKGYVAKSALRPRTGSGATQGRHASGGMQLSTPSAIRQLLSSSAADWFLLYPKVLYIYVHIRYSPVTTNP